MSDRTLEQSRAILLKLNQLQAIAQKQDVASADAHEANTRWNEARKEYAARWSEFVAEHGEAEAPQWFEALRGPKPVLSAREGGL
ncbi:hypothetical protein [Methyloversatilis discipulorum]|uniref:hypothetical protein n=1 Tax=Methyloversatilis discipulorum TaxID=1119528 RepID=UPI000380EA60|nr:hypothetical protein [Methyloversatilis discipulorum]